MKNKILIAIVLVLLLSLHKVDAALPVAKPFGGPILMTYECSCSGGWLVVVFDQSTYTPSPLTFQFGQSMLRANYNIFTPSVQTLGSYTPVGWCSPASTECAGFTTTGTISPFGFPGVGTSSI